MPELSAGAFDNDIGDLLMVTKWTISNGPFQIDFLIDFLSTKENVMLTMNREILENTYFFLLCRVCIADCNNPNIIGTICDAQGLRMNNNLNITTLNAWNKNPPEVT